MPKPTSKSRQELRSRFVRNAIPTETDFADLIAASLNQADDGVLKLPDQPLGLVRQKADQPVLRFFADPAAEGSVWQVQLGAGDKPGFGLAAADGKLALFVDGATGNVGIGTDSLGAKLHIAHINQEPNGGALIIGPTSQSNLRLGYNQGYSWIQSHGSKPLSINAIGNNVGIGTVNPGNKLTVQGTFNESKDPESGITNGGLLALKGNAPQIDFIDTEHGDWSIHVNGGRMYFIREPWEHQDLVLDGKGNIGIGSSVPQAKLNIRELTGTPATALKGTLLLDHEDVGGASSIVFSSRVKRGSDYAFIEFRDKNPLINDGEAALLTIGMQNDAHDHIALMPSGNVGIGTTTPGFKLDVNGAVRLGGLNPILFSSSWTGFPDNKTNGAEICNDTGSYKTLMIVGNKSQGGVRKVSVWDYLEVNGTLKVTGKVDSQNARIQAIANDSIRIASDNWTDMPKMIVTADIDGPVLVLFKTGGVQGASGKNVRARFRLLIDGTEKAFTLHEFHNEGWELRDASLLWLESLTAGNHEFKVQWRAEAGTASACWYGDLRSLIVVKL